MSSNVGQNYPYSSETDGDRAARIDALVAAREGLADKLAAETTPVATASSTVSVYCRRSISSVCLAWRSV